MPEQPKWLADRDTDFEDLRAALEWGAKLELKPEQRGALRKLCCTTPWQPLSASVFGTAQ